MQFSRTILEVVFGKTVPCTASDCGVVDSVVHRAIHGVIDFLKNKDIDWYNMLFLFIYVLYLSNMHSCLHVWAIFFFKEWRALKKHFCFSQNINHSNFVKFKVILSVFKSLFFLLSAFNFFEIHPRRLHFPILATWQNVNFMYTSTFTI